WWLTWNRGASIGESDTGFLRPYPPVSGYSRKDLPAIAFVAPGRIEHAQAWGIGPRHNDHVLNPRSLQAADVVIVPHYQGIIPELFAAQPCQSLQITPCVPAGDFDRRPSSVVDFELALF